MTAPTCVGPRATPRSALSPVAPRVRAKRANRATALAQAILHNLGDAVLSIDSAGAVTYLNPVAEQLTGWKLVQAVGKPETEVLRIVDAVTRSPVQGTLRRAMRDRRTVRLEGSCVLLNSDGSECAVEDAASPIVDAQGQVTGAVMVFRDVTHLRESFRHMAHMAYHDPLTGLPNRMLLRDRIGRAVVQAQRRSKHGAVLFLDLDGFKAVNDANGHAHGDHLLRSVTRRLCAHVRAADTVSRLGGDEFVVLLSEINHGADAATSARKICDALARPHRGLQARLSVPASVGISLFPQDSLDPDTLILYADRAMYGAKQEARGGYRFFTDPGVPDSAPPEPTGFR